MPIERFFKPPENTSYFLFGARGTGKSSLMSALYEKAFCLDLLLPETAHTYHAHPEHLKKAKDH